MLTAARHAIFGGGGGTAPADYWGLCFTAETAGSTVAMVKNGSAPEVTLQTSTDGRTWTPFTVGETVTTLARAGDRVYFAAGAGGNETFAASTTAYSKFVMTGRIAASGDVTSLLDNGATVRNLTGRRRYVFFMLFDDCTSLTTAPDVPSTTLEHSCYYRMFRGCTSLTTAPELPALTMNHSVYAAMFQDCTSLTTAPKLPAKALWGWCYNAMFRGCTSLTAAPKLPAAELKQRCYMAMFYGCKSLRSIEVACESFGPDGDPAYDYFLNWVTGVPASSLCTFRCPAALGTDATIERGISRCPSGWTVVNT